MTDTVTMQIPVSRQTAHFLRTSDVTPKAIDNHLALHGRRTAA